MEPTTDLVTARPAPVLAAFIDHYVGHCIGPNERSTKPLMRRAERTLDEAAHAPGRTNARRSRSCAGPNERSTKPLMRRAERTLNEAAHAPSRTNAQRSRSCAEPNERSTKPLMRRA
ncbi:hypothetical protein AB4305_23455, partial [Nocardia sp. 2YAB30]